MACFGDDLVDGEGGAEDGIVTGEAAVGAVVYAFIGYVEGGEEAHGLAEVLEGEELALVCHCFKLLVVGGRNEVFKFP